VVGDILKIGDFTGYYDSQFIKGVCTFTDEDHEICVYTMGYASIPVWEFLLTGISTR